VPSRSRTVARTLAFLAHAQNADGGFPLEVGGESDAQSTAWAIQGLVAAGQNPAAGKRGVRRSPLAYLESLVAPNGSVRYSASSTQSPVWVTAEALAAFARIPLPVAPVARRGASSTAAHGGRRAGEIAVGGQRAGNAAVGKGWRSGTPGVDARLDRLARSVGVLVGWVLEPLLR
jgi:hypothetical protein